MMILRLNYTQLANDLCDELVKGAQEAMNRFLTEALYGMKATDQELQDAVLDMAEQRIKAAVIFYAQSILESYGRGRAMDESNEYLKDYINSSLWNPARKKEPGAQIVGRPQGSYTNILGETVYSTGEKEGKPTGRNVGYLVPPTFSIQNAEKKLERGMSENGYVMRILKTHAEQFFQNLDPSKYFYNEDISV